MNIVERLKQLWKLYGLQVSIIAIVFVIGVVYFLIHQKDVREAIKRAESDPASYLVISGERRWVDVGTVRIDIRNGGVASIVHFSDKNGNQVMLSNFIVIEYRASEKDRVLETYLGGG